MGVVVRVVMNELMKCILAESARETEAARRVFNTFFLSRARDFTTFTLHDVTDFYVERATALHYNKLSFIPLDKLKNETKIKPSLRARGPLVFRRPFELAYSNQNTVATSY